MAKMSLIQKIANQSYTALCVHKGSSKSDHIRYLMDLVKKLTAKDLNIDTSLLLDQTPYSITSRRAPVTYIDVYEDENFTMGVFVLKPGTRLPLHDHPHMHGLIKVLHGSCRISSYSIDNNQVTRSNEGMLVKVIEKTETVVSLNSDPMVLTPTRGNCHEIQSLGGNLAFFDILSPPYDDNQHQCNYYKPYRPLDGTQQLLHISAPEDYFTERSEYSGPEVDANIVYSSEE